MDLSFLQVLTIGLIKRSSSHFSNFLMCPSFFSRLSSFQLNQKSGERRVCLLIVRDLAARENE